MDASALLLDSIPIEDLLHTAKCLKAQHRVSQGYREADVLIYGSHLHKDVLLHLDLPQEDWVPHKVKTENLTEVMLWHILHVYEEIDEFFKAAVHANGHAFKLRIRVHGDASNTRDGLGEFYSGHLYMGRPTQRMQLSKE